MAKYTSGRQKNLKLGISSYSENLTSLEVIGKVGIGTTNATSSLYVVGDEYVTGSVTATAFYGTFSGNASSATYAPNAGIATYATSSGIATYATSSGIATYAPNAGIATYATSSGIATYATSAGIATQATRLQNSRTFEITGDIVGAAVTFDGTGNVSIAATIQPNSVALGTDTTGDYVQSITGTANQISVSVTSGESSTPVISIPSNPTLPGNVTIANDLQINNNLNVTGNITIGGTSAYIIANEFRVKDADIVLGFTTNISGQDVSNDTTASHGGIAVASTEGNPLVNLNVAGIETLPSTYKQIMWIKSGTFAGLNTDAWIFNYGVGIGSTQIPNGVRLAAGGMQVTDRTLTVPQLNISGVSTFSDTLELDGGLKDIFNTVGVAGSILISTGAGVSWTTPYAAGLQGLQGLQGTQGLQGLQGTQGLQGLQGTGVQGTQGLQGISGSGGSGAITIKDEGTVLGTAVTSLNFVGSGVSVTGNNAGVTVTVSGGGGGGGNIVTRAVARSVATANQTTFNVTYDVGYIDVYLNGIKLDTTEYSATNGTSVILTEGASENDVLEFITFTNLSLSSGLVVADDTTTNSTRYLTHTEAISGGISSIRVSSTQLSFNPSTNTFSAGNIVGTSLNISGISTLGTVSNLNVTGIGTITTLIPTQTRIQSAAEKLVRVDGNSVNINFTTSGSNIGLCTNPTGNITLNVNGIPTDSSFDNHSLLFSVVVIQTGTARTCTAVTLNGVSRTIKWPSGTVGSGTTNSYDIFNFTGINTIGSASTTTNYEVLGLVNGGFR